MKDRKQIARLLSETGILVLGDISEIRDLGKEPKTPRVFEYLSGEKQFVFGKDFQRFTEILAEEKTANELISCGKLKELPPENPNKVSVENLLFGLGESRFRKIPYENGTWDKALAVLLPSEDEVTVFSEKGENGKRRIILERQEDSEN